MTPSVKRQLPPKVNHYVFGILAIALFMGIILGSQVVGVWGTSSKMDNTGQPVPVTGKDPAEIKGWMILQDVSTGYNIPLEEIYAAFKLPTDTPATAQIKDLEGKGENFSTTALKTWMAQKIGMPPPPPLATPKSGGETKTKP
jgi:hypothetical protein